MKTMYFGSGLSAVALAVLVGCSHEAGEAVSGLGGAGQVTVYEGCCDGSAGVAVSSDLFVAANDEESILRVYRRGAGGEPVYTFSAGRFLGLSKGAETDLEGAELVGDTIYWVSSHSRKKSGKAAENRHYLFATQVQVSNGSVEFVPVGEPYRNLVEDMAKAPELARFELGEAARRDSERPGGLNIEGLAATPDGGLLIGFRNPMPSGRALIVLLVNPAEVMEGKPARFGEPVLLDLDGLAIRGMVRREGRYLLIGGKLDGRGNSRIYEWDGRSEKPKLLREIRGDSLNPEAIFYYAGSAPDEFELLSDDGNFKIGRKDCKDLKKNQRRFRSVSVRL